MKQLFALLLSAISVHAAAQPAWQQRVDTKIDVALDDRRHMLRAYEEFTYTNNSPDTLKFIYIHLWPNAYKNDRTPFARQQDLNGSTAFYFSKAKDRGYIDSLSFTVDGQSVEYNSAENVPDIARIDLIEPLLPGRKVTVATPFRVKLPVVFSRNGHTGQAYYISQWFPKPAVYDQLGWHPISYLDQGEFFSEYGSYDVNITLPENYVLMATGNCMDAREQARMDSLSRLPFPSDTLYDHSTPSSSREMKTVHYSEQNIHDFAWFADKRFIVRKDTAYSPGTGQPVITWAGFLPAYQGIWKNATGYLADAINHYGKWVGTYPYKTMKAVLGDMKSGGGMEYPTITLIDKTAKTNLKTVVIHEAGHNWFYGLLGSNERDHAWMDEGINTFYEQKTTNVTGKDSGRVAKSKLDESLLYYELAATDNDQPIDITSAKFAKLNYGMDVYYKTALMLRWLEKYIGAADFELGMKDYFDTWHYHHPYPADFKVCMQRHTAKPLDWFFDAILNTDKKIDFKVTRARVGDKTTEVTVKNNTGVLSPVLIKAYNSNDSVTGSVWSQPFTGKAQLTLPTASWARLKVDEEIPDAKSTNNVYRRHGLFHYFGVQLKPFLGINRGDKDKVFLSPSWGNNQYDGFMLGILLHNLTIPENRFRFAVAPMYGFGSKAINGAASVGYIWYPRDLFKEIMLQADAKSYHDGETHVHLADALYARYIKVAPSLSFIFNEHNALSTVTRTLTLKEYNINEDNIYYGTTAADVPVLKAKQNTYGLLRYQHRNDRTYNPFDYSAEGQIGADFAKINIEGNVRIDYNVKNKALYVRGYVGKFFAINNDPALTARYELNASYSGVDDYLYDGTYKGRNAVDGLSGRQVSVQEGGFKIPVHNGAYRSDDWMATINLKTDLPLKGLPVRLFFDAGLVPNAHPGFKNSNSSNLLYDGGVEVYLLKDVVSVYVPLMMSGDFRDYLTNAYGRKHVFDRSISFTIQLQNINWLKTTTKLLKSVVN